MKCSNCGKVLRSGTNFCPDCGTRVEEQVQEQKVEVTETSTKHKKKNSGIGIAGFVVGLCGLCCTSIVMSIIGLVFSSVALKSFDVNTQKNKGFAVAGLVISIVGLVFSVIKTIAEWHWHVWIF